MARGRVSFRDKVRTNSQQQRSKTANYGHLRVPSGVPIFKEEADSRVSIDLLPYVVTDDHHPDRNDEFETAVKGSYWYRRPYKLHRNVGAASEAVVCLTSVGKKCPICEYRKKLLDEGANWKDKSVSELRAGERNLYYAQPKGDRKLEDRPHLWDVSQGNFQKQLNSELEENDEYCDFADLEDGLTLKVRFAEETFEKNKFAKASRIDFERRDYAYEEAEVDRLPSLDDVLIVKDYRELEELFFADGDGDDEAAAAEARAARSEERPADDGPRTTTRPKGTTREQPRDPEPEPERQAEKSGAGFTRGRRGAGAEKPPEDPAPADDKAARRAARAQREKGAEANPCPHGHVFGRECDKHSECEDCEKWGACMDELERLQKAA